MVEMKKATPIIRKQVIINKNSILISDGKIMKKINQKLLITGANGSLGSLVVKEILSKKDGEKIILGSRQPDNLKHYVAEDVEVRKVDFEDVSSLVEAFAGVDKLLLISTKAIGEQRQRQHRNAIDAAVKAGVKHVIYTSMINPEESLVTFAPDHDQTEKTLKSSGLEWTILRNSWYMDNLLASLPQALASGQWNTAAGEGKIAHVSREDCAEAAAAALLSTTTSNRQLDITGPEAFTIEGIAKIVSDIFGKSIKVNHLSDIVLKETLLSAGVPAPFAPVVVSSEANTRAGNMNIVSNAVKDLTGHNPKSLRDFFAVHKSIQAHQ
jgi:NAD(P)H dehydrogenase (quinone)